MLPHSRMPGTVMPFPNRAEAPFAVIEEMLLAAGGFSLSQLSALTGLEGTTIQNWVKRGWILKPKNNKKYSERHVARILLISALRDCMQIEQIVTLMDSLNIPAGYGYAAQYMEIPLYNYFCRMILRIDLCAGFSQQTIFALAEDVTIQYQGFTADARDRMIRVLVIMSFCYMASMLKQRADRLFQQTFGQ